MRSFCPRRFFLDQSVHTVGESSFRTHSKRLRWLQKRPRCCVSSSGAEAAFIALQAMEVSCSPFDGWDDFDSRGFPEFGQGCIVG